MAANSASSAAAAGSTGTGLLLPAESDGRAGHRPVHCRLAGWAGHVEIRSATGRYEAHPSAASLPAPNASPRSQLRYTLNSIRLFA